MVDLPPRFTCEQCGKDTRVVRYYPVPVESGSGVGYDWECGCHTTDDGVHGAGGRVLDGEARWTQGQRRLHEEYAGRCPCWPCREDAELAQAWSKDDDAKDE